MGGGILHAVMVSQAGGSGSSVTLHDGPGSTHPMIAVIDAASQRSMPAEVRRFRVRLRGPLSGYPGAR